MISGDAIRGPIPKIPQEAQSQPDPPCLSLAYLEGAAKRNSFWF